MQKLKRLKYLNKLNDIVQSVQGGGIIYWEPAWVSSTCKTLWGVGSHWDNATLFDHSNIATEAMNFYNN